MGVKYDNIAKVLGKEVYGEGLHAGPPGFSFIIFPSVFQTMQFRDITVCENSILLCFKRFRSFRSFMLA